MKATEHYWRVIATLNDGATMQKVYPSLKDARQVMSQLRATKKYQSVQVGFRLTDQQ